MHSRLLLFYDNIIKLGFVIIFIFRVAGKDVRGILAIVIETYVLCAIGLFSFRLEGQSVIAEKLQLRYNDFMLYIFT